MNNDFEKNENKEYMMFFLYFSLILTHSPSLSDSLDTLTNTKMYVYSINVSLSLVIPSNLSRAYKYVAVC